jgi:hypothetical protein
MQRLSLHFERLTCSANQETLLELLRGRTCQVMMLKFILILYSEYYYLFYTGVPFYTIDH